jgi:dihydrofolate reductase
MPKVTSHLSISLDGYVAGPHQSLEHPLGVGGDRLHEWAFASPPAETDARVIEDRTTGVGAYVMGRKMFGGGDGGWDAGWRGWWGEEPPFHAPVFVLTHHEREPLEMQGGTTFHFATTGAGDALRDAQAAAGEQEVAVAGGASTVRQYLAAGRLDELHLHIVPVVLGAGERLLDGVGDLQLEIAQVTASPAVTHVSYRVLT